MAMIADNNVLTYYDWFLVTVSIRTERFDQTRYRIGHPMPGVGPE